MGEVFTHFFIAKTQLEILKKLGLPEVKENNKWFVLHVKGDGVRAPTSWNAKVYTNKGGDLKAVTTDEQVLHRLLGDEPVFASPAKSRIISIDDSGRGFPLGGTLVGLHDSFDNSFHYGEVTVGYYLSL